MPLIAQPLRVPRVLARVADADILVNNLGIYARMPFFEIPDAEWLRYFEVNVLSGVRFARHYARAMAQRKWGRVLLVSSESGLNIPREMIHYGMSKTAQLSITRGLAMDFRLARSQRMRCCRPRRREHRPLMRRAGEGCVKRSMESRDRISTAGRAPDAPTLLPVRSPPHHLWAEVPPRTWRGLSVRERGRSSHHRRCNVASRWRRGQLPVIIKLGAEPRLLEHCSHPGRRSHC